MIQQRIASVEEKLNSIGEADKRVQLLRTIWESIPDWRRHFVVVLELAIAISESESSKWLYRDGAKKLLIRATPCRLSIIRLKARHSSVTGGEI